MNFYLCLLLALFSVLHSNSQTNLHTADSMRFYGEIMFTSENSNQRVLAETNFLSISKQLIQHFSDTNLLSFHTSFIKTSSKNKKIKLISWMTDCDSLDYKYYAYVFKEGKKPILLKSVTRNIHKINYEEFDTNNWYGAIYYYILPETLNGYYTIFGYRLDKSGTKFRIIDLMKLDSDEIKIGAPFFQVSGDNQESDLLFRKVIPYSASANLSVTYDADSKMIYYDHTESINDRHTGEPLLVPDGTFEAFELKNKFWNFIPYLKLKTVKSPPRDKPILDTREKDLFGRKKKK